MTTTTTYFWMSDDEQASIELGRDADAARAALAEMFSGPAAWGSEVHGLVVEETDGACWTVDAADFAAGS